jgi:hypothetical protein
MTETRWTTSELTEAFKVLGFAYGLCIVERRSDGVRGTLTFHRENIDGRDVRVYTDWAEGGDD